MATTCVEWTKARTRGGYGVTTVDGKAKYLHRLEMEKKIGRPLTSDEVVCHSCDNRACYNIDHLFLGTHTDNHRDMVAKGRQAKGFALPHTRLSAADLAGIRWFRHAGVKVKDIARLYQVHQSHVSKITASQRCVA